RQRKMIQLHSLLISVGFSWLGFASAASFGQEPKHRETLGRAEKGMAGWVQLDQKEKTLIAYCHPHIKVWEWPGCKLLATIDPGVPVTNLALHPDGKKLAIGSSWGNARIMATIKVWDLEKQRAVFSRHENLKVESFPVNGALHPHKNL